MYLRNKEFGNVKKRKIQKYKLNNKIIIVKEEINKKVIKNNENRNK